jgi:flagellar hook protein FlgE
MALSSALFSGISGLSTLGSAMQIIGDNISNVNTVGFKSSRFTFQDLLSQSTATMSGTAQVGRGTAMGDITSLFLQGSFESTGNTTDLAIGGDGFFQLRESGSNELFYSRAGNFRFDNDGYLVNPEGYVVQGWELDPDTGQDVGSVTDIQLDSFTSPPEESTQIQLITNLDSSATSQTNSLTNAWEATNDPPIAASNHEYQSTVKVYDSLGDTHDVTVYYDPVSDSTWEYMVVCNPDEDARAGFAGTSSAGLLARGNITFSDSSGTITDLTMETLGAAGHEQSAALDGATTVADASVSINNPQAVTQDTTVDITLTYAAGTWAVAGGAPYAVAINGANNDPNAVDIALNGSGNADISITSAAGAAAGETVVFSLTGSANWTAAATNANGYYEFTPDFIGGNPMAVEFNPGTQDDGSGAFVNDSLTTTQFASASTTTFQSGNGYGAGDLQGVDVDVDGVMTGIYSNGQILPLYRVTLAKFQNEQGLHKEGGNLFRETRESGDAITGQPGTNGLGSIAPNSLEQSNVDIANEFVKMITTQRGFQANGKIITVTDQMLAELINLKR